MCRRCTRPSGGSIPSRRMDVRRIPEGGRSLPQGRLSVRYGFGAELVNIKGEITVESDNVRRVMEYGQQLVKSFPADTVGYDDTSNNRALISGKSALIYNPQSAWAVAKRDAPEDREGLLDLPLPHRTQRAVYPVRLRVLWYLGVRQEQKRSKGTWPASTRARSARRASRSLRGIQFTNTSQHVGLQDLGRGRAAESTVYNFPIRPWHTSTPSLAAYPTPPEIAVQNFTRAIPRQCGRGSTTVDQLGEVRAARIIR